MSGSAIRRVIGWRWKNKKGKYFDKSSSLMFAVLGKMSSASHKVYRENLCLFAPTLMFNAKNMS